MLNTYTRGFRQLIAWQKAHQLTLVIYRVTQYFPRDELYAMTSQLRRASSSIEAQIAEGSRMQTQAHRKIFYDRAYASSAEVDTFPELAHDLGYVSRETYTDILHQLNAVSALVYKLSLSCKAK